MGKNEQKEKEGVLKMWNMCAVRQAEAMKYGKNKSKTLAGMVR